MSPLSDYVELRCRSAFSFLEAASNPEDLVSCAAELGYPALALGDVGGVYGIPRFHQAAQRAGLRAIVGAQIFVADANAEGPSAKKTTSLLLLVETQQGYRNLCRILTESHRHVAKAASLNRWEEIEEYAEGLTALAHGDASLQAVGLDRAKATFGSKRLWVDISRQLDRATEAAGRRAAALAHSARVKLVATGDVRHARPEGRKLFDALTCLREKTSLDQAGRHLAINAERHLHNPSEMARRFADQPAWISATREIAERCAFSLENLGYRFPRYPVPSGETQASYLWQLTFRGGRSRYGSPIPPRAQAQLEHELALIEKLGLPGYFLIVHDIVQFAKNQNILSQGRGSAANSAVCYALGITAVDPVGMELLFERFLSEERGEWPDIDIDLPSGKPREKVIQYVFDKYGAHGAAMTAVVITYRTRMAVREMGKVLGIEANTLERLSKTIAHLEHRESLDEFTEFLNQAGVDPKTPRIAGLLDLVERVRGLPRHLGQHTGGVIISGGRLDEIVPIEPASMPDRRVIQWDKEDCADLGLIKIDLLGLGMLAAIEDTLELIKKHEDVVIDLAHLPADDPTTYAMIQRADTIGTFQIESRAQMATLPRMKPKNFYDLVVEIAMIRPGPIAGQMVHPYLNRRAGREAVTYPHPSLEPILKRTLGVPLFQEQLLRIAMVAAGFSGGEAEELRRAMGFKRSVKRMEQLEARLRQGMTERGVTGENQEEIIRGIHSFALYGFPESHAASFALITYASAFLKAHHPAAFLAGLLNAYPMGFYAPATLVKDAQRHGVDVRPIDVAHSYWRCTLENQQPPSGPPALRSALRPALRLGLRYVNGFRRETGLALEAERATASFTSVADFAKRVPLNRNELDTLAELGALAHLDGSTRTRRSSLWQIAALETDPGSLFAGITPEGDDSPLPEMSPLEETLADYRHSGITTGPQILAHLRPALRASGILSSAELKSVPNGRLVQTAGQVIVRQRPETAKGFVFLTLEDETGTSNAILTPRQFRHFRAALHSTSIIQIKGPIQNQEGVIHLRVQHLEALEHCEELPDGHDYH